MLAPTCARSGSRRPGLCFSVCEAQLDLSELKLDAQMQELSAQHELTSSLRLQLEVHSARFAGIVRPSRLIGGGAETLRVPSYTAAGGDHGRFAGVLAAASKNVQNAANTPHWRRRRFTPKMLRYSSCALDPSFPGD